MPYFAAQVANEFIRRAKSEGIVVDPLKLQKLVYLAHGWHLAFLDAPLIKEGVEAWRYGPVVPSLYRQFRHLGVSPITAEAPLPSSDIEQISQPSLDLINQVWQIYGRKSGLELSMLTHEPGYAWDIIRSARPDDWNSPSIPNDYIRDEFIRRKAKS
jgi:uncharacterized phage-associated protein